MSRLAAFSSQCMRGALGSAVDLINTWTCRKRREVRHTLVTLRQLVTLYDPVDFQRAMPEPSGLRY